MLDPLFANTSTKHSIKYTSQSLSHAHSAQPRPQQPTARAELPWSHQALLQPSPTPLPVPGPPGARRAPTAGQSARGAGVKERSSLDGPGLCLLRGKHLPCPGWPSVEPCAHQAAPRLSGTSHKLTVGAKRAAPRPPACTGSQQAGADKASQPPPLPTHGIVPERGTSRRASSLPSGAPGCGASALWSRLLLKPLGAGEGSYSNRGPALPGSRCRAWGAARSPPSRPSRPRDPHCPPRTEGTAETQPT